MHPEGNSFSESVMDGYVIISCTNMMCVVARRLVEAASGFCSGGHLECYTVMY
jgi:hypothetical protein